MRRIVSVFVFSCIVLFSTICFAGLNDCPRVAVLQFNNKAKTNKNVLLDKQSIGFISEYIISTLLETGKFSVVDLYFDSLDMYAQYYNVDIKELKKDQDKNRIANLFGVKYLIDGAVTDISDNNADGLTKKKKLNQARPSQPVEYKVMLQVRFTDTKTKKKCLLAQGYGLIKAKSQRGKLSASEINDVLYSAAKDAVNGTNGVLAKMKEQTQDKISN